MRQYDSKKPLIFIHVPKTAGTSVQRIFESWFGENLLLHYRGKKPPLKYDLARYPNPSKPLAIYGHFNQIRGIGADEYYPQVDQFITIFRDPWERVISGYFYRKKRFKKWPFFAKVTSMDLEEYISKWPFEDPDYGPPMSNFLARNCDVGDYKEMLNTYYVDIGVAENLPTSLKRIAGKLGVSFCPDDLPHINKAKRSAEIPLHLKPDFIARLPLEYALYNYALELNV